MGLVDYQRIYIYITIIIILLVVVILSITFSEKPSNKKIETQIQEDVELEETDDFPPFDKIVYAVVDSYEGYIELPEHATYPAKLLEYLEEWTVSGDRKIVGRTYLMNKKLAGQDCEWKGFKGNQYCILKEKSNNYKL